MLPELSFTDRWSRGTKLWERDLAKTDLDGITPGWADQYLGAIICRSRGGFPTNENGLKNASNNNKQLLDEVEHDIMNYQNRGLCYLPKPKAEADNTDLRFW